MAAGGKCQKCKEEKKASQQLKDAWEEAKLLDEENEIPRDKLAEHGLLTSDVDFRMIPTGHSSRRPELQAYCHSPIRHNSFQTTFGGSSKSGIVALEERCHF